MKKSLIALLFISATQAAMAQDPVDYSPDQVGMNAGQGSMEPPPPAEMEPPMGEVYENNSQMVEQAPDSQPYYNPDNQINQDVMLDNANENEVENNAPPLN